MGNIRKSPAIIAISAILKIPDRKSPMPIFKKSTTFPSKIRSMMLLPPPAIMKANAILCQGPTSLLKKRVKPKYPKAKIGIIAKTQNLTFSGRSDPKLKNAPSFSA